MTTTSVDARHKPRADTRSRKQSLDVLVDTVIDSASDDSVTIRTVLRAVGDASFAPVLLLPALAVATPLSGVPLFSALMGMIIFLISVQMILRRDHLWLPRWLLDRAVTSSIVRSAFSSLKPFAGWLDRRTQPRYGLLFHRPLILVPQAICMISGAVMPLLEFVPFSSSIVGAGVALLAFGLTSRDGLFLLIGLIPYGGVIWLLIASFG